MSKMGSEEFEKLKVLMREDTKTFTETHYVHLINEIKAKIQQDIDDTYDELYYIDFIEINILIHF